jgi:23S rRNA pseudouridine1911/1915/1917 synthase
MARGGYTLAGVQLKTGRKHQIRAHAEWLGHRVVGDKLYGSDPGLYLEFAIHGWTARHTEMLGMPRQALHCAAIDLRPTGLDYLLRAPWPADMSRFAEQHMALSSAEAQQLLDTFVTENLK